MRQESNRRWSERRWIAWILKSGNSSSGQIERKRKSIRGGHLRERRSPVQRLISKRERGQEEERYSQEFRELIGGQWACLAEVERGGFDRSRAFQVETGNPVEEAVLRFTLRQRQCQKSPTPEGSQRSALNRILQPRSFRPAFGLFRIGKLAGHGGSAGGGSKRETQTERPRAQSARRFVARAQDKQEDR